MATKVSITQFVDSLLGESGTQVPDAVIMAGMEDVIAKLEKINPDALRDMNVETTITTNPVTLHYASPSMSVFRNGEKAIRVEDAERITNSLSLANDLGNTAYYYVIGNNLYIHPFLPLRNTYTMHGIAYAVSNGNVTWADRYTYPLAMYCAHTMLFRRLNEEISAIAEEMSGLTGLSLDFASVTTRLTKDDVELAMAELEKLRTQIQQYSAVNETAQISVGRLGVRTEGLKTMLARYQIAKANYLEYFGIAGGN